MHEGRLIRRWWLRVAIATSDYAKAIVLAAGVPLVVTAALWRLRAESAIEHPVFFFLPPAAAMAAPYGFVGAALFAFAALGCAAFFLYDRSTASTLRIPKRQGSLSASLGWHCSEPNAF